MAWKLKNFSFSAFFLIAFMILLALFMLLPVIFILNNALKPLNELFLFPPTFFVKHATFQNFKNLFLATAGDVVPFTRYLFNSIVIAAITLLGVIMASTMAGYVLSKHRFQLKGVIMGAIMISLMFAPETVLIPRFLVISGLGFMDTYPGHVLPFIASPVAVFLVKQFIDQIPDALIEAAKLEGASEFAVFLRIVMPLALPAIATIAILTFQTVWMDIEGSVYYMQDETMKTLAYYVLSLTNVLQNQVAGQGIAAAAALLIFVPNLVMFLLFQKWVIQTVAHSGLK